MPADPFYVSKAWVNLRNAVRQKWLRAGNPCHYCGDPLAFGQAVVVDHVISRKKRPDLSLVESNLVVVHHACNSKKSLWDDNSQKKAVNEQGYPAGWD